MQTPTPPDAAGQPADTYTSNAALWAAVLIALLGTLLILAPLWRSVAA